MYDAVDKRLDEWVTFEKVSEYDGLQAAQQPLLSHTSSGLVYGYTYFSVMMLCHLSCNLSYLYNMSCMQRGYTENDSKVEAAI